MEISSLGVVEVEVEVLGVVEVEVLGVVVEISSLGVVEVEVLGVVSGGLGVVEVLGSSGSLVIAPMPKLAPDLSWIMNFLMVLSSLYPLGALDSTSSYLPSGRSTLIRPSSSYRSSRVFLSLSPGFLLSVTVNSSPVPRFLIFQEDPGRSLLSLPVFLKVKPLSTGGK